MTNNEPAYAVVPAQPPAGGPRWWVASTTGLGVVIILGSLGMLAALGAHSGMLMTHVLRGGLLGYGAIILARWWAGRGAAPGRLGLGRVILGWCYWLLTMLLGGWLALMLLLMTGRWVP